MIRSLTISPAIASSKNQTLQKIIPEAVSKNANGYLMVNNDPILWSMLNAIKEQQKEIAELKTEVRKLRATRQVRRK